MIRDKKRFLTNIFITFIIISSFGFGLTEKFISQGFQEDNFKNHPLFIDDTRNVRDQDFWPFSSYPMFSDGYHNPQVSRIEIRGVTQDDKELVLKISKVLYPLWENGLHRMLKKAIVHNKSEGKIMDSLSRLFQERINHNTLENIENYKRIIKLDWYIQLWDFDTWVNFRKTHGNLNEWHDYKESSYSPIYSKLFHTSSLND